MAKLVCEDALQCTTHLAKSTTSLWEGTTQHVLSGWTQQIPSTIKEACADVLPKGSVKPQLFHDHVVRHAPRLSIPLRWCLTSQSGSTELGTCGRASFRPDNLRFGDVELQQQARSSRMKDS